MKILITGGSGFIGSHCVDEFEAAGHEVLVYDVAAPIHTPQVNYMAGDLLDSDRIAEAVKQCSVVVHAGGMLGTHETVMATQQSVQTNVIGTLNVLQATTRYGAKLINISKPNVWLNPYSISKDSVEKFCFMYVDEFDAQVAVVKLYNVYGPRQKYNHVRKAIPTWFVDVLNGNPVEIFGSGSATVDLIHARDVGRGIAAVMDNFEVCRIKPTVEVASDVWSRFPKHNEQILELGSGKCITVKESVEWVGKATGRPVEIRHLPMRRGEIDGTHLCADMTRMTALTGFVSEIGLLEGLQETLAYYTQNLPQVAEGIL